MHRYYWAAKAVTQLNQILMLNIEERINGSRGRADAADQRALPRPRRHARGGAATTSTPSDPHAILRDLPGLPADARHQGPVGAHAARAVQRARPDGRGASAATRSTARLFMQILRAARAASTHALRLMNQTSVLGRYLWVFRRIVGQHAARPVPRLHGRPAHPDGAAQRAPLLHPRARARVPVLLAAGQRSGTSPGCCTSRRCSTTWPRAAAATTPSSARAEARRFCRDHGIDARRHRADRVPGARTT